MTEHMRNALKKAKHAPLRRVHTPGPGKPPWPANACTLYALERHELLERRESRNREGLPVTLWEITEAGRSALRPVERVVDERPVFLARPTRGSGDYTTNPARRIDSAEVMDPDRVSLRWRRRSEVAKVAAVDRKVRAREAARKARYAT